MSAQTSALIVLQVLGEQRQDVGARARPGCREVELHAQERSHPLPHGKPRPVQPALDRLDAHAQHLGDLGRGQPFHVTQQEHLPVAGSSAEMAASITSSTCFPATASSGAAAGSASRPASAATSVSRERSSTGSELAPTPLLEAVAAGDGVEPGRQRGGTAEVANAPGHGQQRVLEDVPGVLGVAAHLHAEPIDLRLVALEQYPRAPGHCRPSPPRAAAHRTGPSSAWVIH